MYEYRAKLEPTSAMNSPSVLVEAGAADAHEDGAKDPPGDDPNFHELTDLSNLSLSVACTSYTGLAESVNSRGKEPGKRDQVSEEVDELSKALKGAAAVGQGGKQVGETEEDTTSHDGVILS